MISRALVVPGTPLLVPGAAGRATVLAALLTLRAAGWLGTTHVVELGPGAAADAALLRRRVLGAAATGRLVVVDDARVDGTSASGPHTAFGPVVLDVLGTLDPGARSDVVVAPRADDRPGYTVTRWTGSRSVGHDAGRRDAAAAWPAGSVSA